MGKKKENNYPSATSFHCPHCETRAQFNAVFPDFDKPNYIDNCSYEIKDFRYIYTIWKCQVCYKLLFRVVKVYKHKDDFELIAQYPSKIRIDTNFKNIVPKEILEDFESALKCYEFAEYRASAAMSRRALQASMLEQGADPDKDLIGQINELNKKKPDRFTNDIKDWAHNIRIFGNWGAHPDKDGLRDVTNDIAEEVINFLKSYFNYVYVMPQKVSKARKTQKTTKKQP